MNQPAPAPIQAAAASPTCPLCGELYTIQNVSRLPDQTLYHVGCPKRTGVNPPDAARPTPATMAAPVPAEVIPTLPPAAAAAATAHAHAVATMGTSQTPAPQAAAPAAAPEKAPRKRRSPKAAAAPAPSTGSLAASADYDLSLFVDALPIKGITCEPLDDYIEDICEEISTAAGVSDIRFAPEQSAIGFGKWKGALAAAVKSAPPPAGVYAIFYVAESEIKQVVVDALTSIASLVVRSR